VRKTYVYRLYPTKRQRTLLRHTLEECRWLYNHLLEERKTTYEQTGQGLTRYQQQATLPALKQERPSLQQVYAQVLQQVVVRVDLAFQAFFRRVKAGQKPGYPRFKGPGRYDSFTYPQFGFRLTEQGRLFASGSGHLKIVLHRPLRGRVKTLTLRRTATDKWYACFSVEEEPERLPEHPAQVGIDVGLSRFATLSDGTVIENPRFFRQEERALARVQRRHAKLEQGSPERRRHRKAVARVHERIAWRRKDFAHQHSRRIVNTYGFIAVEDLHVNRLLHHNGLAKSIADAAWSTFFDLLFCKAAEAGRTVVKVHPAYTSQTCSQCGHRQPLPLEQRVFVCPCCHAILDRDLNAARNILALGLQSQGVCSQEAPAFSHGE
jgi:putative transposase